MVTSPPLALGSLVQVAQYSTDLDASVAFYRDVLGARFLGKFVPPGLALVELGGVRLLLEERTASATLYFRVADVDAAFAALKTRDVTLVGEPHLVHRDAEGQFGPAGEEEWMTFVRDPSGNMIALVERRRPA